MHQIFKYSFFDMIRNRWMFVYMGFYFLLTASLFLLSNDITKVVVSLNNFVLYLTPLVSILFASMYYYNSEEFIELLLAQPISRKSIVFGLYLGMLASLSLSLIIGIGLPIILFGHVNSVNSDKLLLLIGVAIILTLIFSLIAFIISISNKNRIRGFGISIFVWLFFSIIYDGIFLLLLLFLKEYPLEKLTLTMSSLNPIDLSRILVLLNLDISAMMGYTGAVMQKFFTSSLGTFYIIGILSLWASFLGAIFVRKVNRKDF